MATKAKVRKSHFVAIRKANGGGYNLTELKPWLRSHLADDPSGGKPENMTSHELRNALKKKGWKVEEVVICIKP
jgi:hypothetical protein